METLWAKKYQTELPAAQEGKVQRLKIEKNFKKWNKKKNYLHDGIQGEIKKI